MACMACMPMIHMGTIKSPRCLLRAAECRRCGTTFPAAPPCRPALWTQAACGPASGGTRPWCRRSQSSCGLLPPLAPGRWCSLPPHPGARQRERERRSLRAVWEHQRRLPRQQSRRSMAPRGALKARLALGGAGGPPRWTSMHTKPARGSQTALQKQGGSRLRSQHCGWVHACMHLHLPPHAVGPLHHAIYSRRRLGSHVNSPPDSNTLELAPRLPSMPPAGHPFVAWLPYDRYPGFHRVPAACLSHLGRRSCLLVRTWPAADWLLLLLLPSIPMEIPMGNPPSMRAASSALRL